MEVSTIILTIASFLNSTHIMLKGTNNAGVNYNNQLLLIMAHSDCC